MALKIDTQGKSLSYNGEVIPSRNVSQVEKIGQFIRIYLVFSSRSYIEIQFSDIYVDNVVFTDVDLALQFFQSNFFAEASQGGGVPTLGNLQFIVGGASGNETRTLEPKDVGWTPAVGNARVLSLGNGSAFQYIQSVTGVVNGSLAQRTGNGQLSASPATVDTSCVVLSQLKGIINDTLTASETSATLNAMYSSFQESDKVTSLDNAVEYIKRSPTQWDKRLLTLV